MIPFTGDPEEKLLLSGLKRRYKGRDEERPLIGLALHAAELAFVHPGDARADESVGRLLPHTNSRSRSNTFRKFLPSVSRPIAAPKVGPFAVRAAIQSPINRQGRRGHCLFDLAVFQGEPVFASCSR